jgi:hypothetical protein
VNGTDGLGSIDANDPTRTSAVLFCCNAKRSFRSADMLGFDVGVLVSREGTP